MIILLIVNGGKDMTRIEETIKRHDKGYNCAQSIVCTYCDLVGLDEATAFKIAEGLGLGCGCMEGTCGALTGAVLLAGCKNSTVNLEKPNSKGSTYKVSREIITKFNEKNHATICKELKGIETGKMLRACPDCIRDAASIVEEVLFNEE